MQHFLVLRKTGVQIIKSINELAKNMSVINTTFNIIISWFLCWWFLQNKNVTIVNGRQSLTKNSSCLTLTFSGRFFNAASFNWIRRLFMFLSQSSSPSIIQKCMKKQRRLEATKMIQLARLDETS